jgi:hypothetical protein
VYKSTNQKGEKATPKEYGTEDTNDPAIQFFLFWLHRANIDWIMENLNTKKDKAFMNESLVFSRGLKMGGCSRLFMSQDEYPLIPRKRELSSSQTKLMSASPMLPAFSVILRAQTLAYVE